VSASPSGGATSGTGSSAGSGATGGSGSAAGGNGGGRDNSSVAAFVASPVFAHVAATVPTTITASPVVVSRLGVPCQTVTQTINIGGQDVHASAMLCHEPGGGWRIVPPQSARADDQRSAPIEIFALAPPLTER